MSHHILLKTHRYLTRIYHTFGFRSAELHPAFSVIGIPKPTASRRSGLWAFRAVHEISGKTHVKLRTRVSERRVALGFQCHRDPQADCKSALRTVGFSCGAWNIRVNPCQIAGAGFGAPSCTRLSVSSGSPSRLQVGAPDCGLFVRCMKYPGKPMSYCGRGFRSAGLHLE